MDIPSIFPPINTGFQIIVGEIPIFRMHQDDELETGSRCHLVDDMLHGLCNTGYSNDQDLFKG